MTTEYLEEKKSYYEGKYNYFNNIEFEHLAADFKGVVDLIGEMGDHIKEKENGNEV